MTPRPLSPGDLRPNVLWIFCDELRGDALSCYGNSLVPVRTPHIDRIAESGVVFDEYYVNSPVCVPSRTAILTGMAPEQTGVYHNEAYAPGYPLPQPLTTFPEVFAAHGYRTLSFGKQHVPGALRPWQVHDPAGSDMRELMDGTGKGESRPIRAPGNGSVVGGCFPGARPYPPTRVTDNVLAALADPDERPFLIRASYLQPHTPVIVPQPWSNRYRPADFPGRPTGHDALSLFERRFGEVNRGSAMTPPDFQQAQADYYGLVCWVDDQVRQLLAALDEHGLTERTIVVLTTDHGAYLGEEGSYGKHTFAPQVQRVPLIIRHPRMLPGGQRRADLSQSLDVGKTLFGLCGIPGPDQFGGRDLFADSPPTEIFATIGYGAEQSTAFPNLSYGTYTGDRGWPRRSCVRTHRYRLDLSTRIDGSAAACEEEDIFLADRLTDPGETQNRAAEPAFRQIADDLRRRVLQHAVGAMETPDELIYSLFQPPAPVGTSSDGVHTGPGTHLAGRERRPNP